MLKVRKATDGAGEQKLMNLDPLAAASLAKQEENTHSFILKYFSKEWKILDAGCGIGRWIIHLDDLGFNVSGIDRSPEAIESLKSIKPEIDLRVGDITSMPYPDGKFDAVLSVGVVEHDPTGPDNMLIEMNRVVRDEGMMLIVVPVECWLRALVHRPLCAIRYFLLSCLGRKLEFEEYRFSSYDFSNRVKRSGWQVLDYSWVDLIPPDKSYSLWVDWGNMFRDSKGNEPFKLNRPGRLIKHLNWMISPWTITEGIIIAARKIRK